MGRRKLRDQQPLHQWKHGPNEAQMTRMCDGARVHEIDAEAQDAEARKYPRVQPCRRCRRVFET